MSFNPGNADAMGVSAMPLPPLKYINNYTNENIESGRAPLPPKPIKDSYTVFGVPYSNDDQIVRPLEEQGIRRLYPQTFDLRRELRKLNHSILVNFVDLLDILIKLPESNKRQEKIDDLSLLFTNMHHVINTCRPHQARETLKAMLKSQLSDRKQMITKFQSKLEEASGILSEAIDQLPDNMSMQASLKFATQPATTTNNLHTNTTANASMDTDYARNVDDDDADDGGIDVNALRDDMMCDIVDSLE